MRHYQLNLVVRHLFTERQKNRLEAVGADLAGGGDDALVDFFGYPRRNRDRALFARPDQIPLILQKLEKNEIRTVELEPHHRDQLLKNPKAEVRARAKALLEGKGTGELDELIAQMAKKVFPLEGDRVRGEKVYMTNCSTCHRLHGQGYKVGADLTSVAGRDRLSLLTDILDPNRNVDRAFRTTLLILKDGDVQTGLFRREEGEMLVLADSTGKEKSVSKNQVQERRESETSLMPDNFSDVIPLEDFNHLIAYLLSKGSKAAALR